MRPTATDTGTDRPFRDAIGLTPLGDGRFRAELGDRFVVGTKAHGGLLMVLLARAGLARVDAEAPGAAPTRSPSPPTTSARPIRGRWSWRPSSSSAAGGCRWCPCGCARTTG